MGAWQSTSKGEYEYDSFENETMYVESDWDGKDWIEMFKYKNEYKYDPSGNITEQILYSWEDDDWLASFKDKYEYNDAGDIIMSESYSWYYETNEWVGWEKYGYLYDDATKELITMTTYRWEDNDWIESNKYDYTYDVAGNMTIWVGYYWENNDWVETDKAEYIYDLDYSITDLVFPPDFYMNNKILWDKYYSWDGTDWEEYNIRTYYWSERDINAIQDITPSSSFFSVYPNPATTEIHVKIDTKETVDYVIYNNIAQAVMYGKLKDDSTIDIQSLSTGIYFLRVSEKTVKVIKQ
jgi:hypothetical protein